MAVRRGVSELAAAVDVALATAQQHREQVARSRTHGEGELLAVRGQLRELAAAAEQLREQLHRREVGHAEQRLRLTALTDRAQQDYGLSTETLLAEYGPDQPVPPDADADPQTPPAPYQRAAQVKRAAAAERALAQLGRINPLAMEEYEALTERHRFLTSQLEDLTRTKRELLGIVKDVDEHIEQVFRAAFEDTAREFAEVFTVLFPGGSGRLELTDPQDLMASGIDVVARPAGKKVSRLSLLSGGERSLAAIALLVAIFRARPSPFYVLDEVEAALDERNLARLLACLEGLRERSQLIVITHQKRTMEIADALYGVSMQGDGVSTVISQRLRERQDATA